MSNESLKDTAAADLFLLAAPDSAQPSSLGHSPGIKMPKP